MPFPRTLSAFLAFLIIACSAGPAFALDIYSVRFGPHPDKMRAVFELSESSPFRAFMLADPVRLVIDLPTFEWKAGSITRPAGIDAIRQGPMHAGISRIVIDLASPALIQSAFILPRKDGQRDRLVVDFSAATTQQFSRNRSIVHGKLDEQAAAMAQSRAIAAQPVPEVNVGSLPVPPPEPRRKPQSSSSYKPLIVIDAGHGGEDPGALGSNGLKEKNITLAMARDLKKYLETTGRYRVHLTRDKDVFIRLSQRVSIARAKQADLFISLHADSINRSGVSGASIYTLSEKASDKETEKLAARENLADAIAGIDLSHEDADVANILVDLTVRDTMNQAKFFANTTVRKLQGNGVRVLENPHRYAGFAVLKAPDIPSILIELGYMSNTRESVMLSKPEYRGQIAKALGASIDSYFDTVRR